jgi:uncharacterized membrane protein YphA (DoxX/SURF4 family)
MMPQYGKWTDAIWILVRWGLAVVFIYAGVLKLRDAAAFAASIARFEMLPPFLIHPVALGLPPLEILCGFALLASPWRRPAAFGVTVLCLLFLAALMSAAFRGISVGCSCFGSAEAEPIWRTIGRDALLLAASYGLYVRSLRQRDSAQAGVIPPRSLLNETA